MQSFSSYKSVIILCLCAFPIIAGKTNDPLFESCFERANTHFFNAQFDEAISFYEQALTLNTAYPQVYYNLGMSYLNKQGTDKKALDRALENFEKAIAMNASYTRALLQAGNCLQKKEKLNEALAYYKKVIELEPNNKEAYLNAGIVLGLLWQFDEALTQIKRALEIDPKYPDALLSLGNAYNMVSKPELALQAYQDLGTLLPNHTTVLYNIGYTLKKMNKLEESLACYDQVLQQNPNHADAHFGRGLSLLLMGKFDEGWPEYEWRWQRSGYSVRNFQQPQWDGVSDLHGKTLFLHAEQGLGDTLQFIRYAQCAKELGATVIFASQTALIKLLERCPYIDKVISLQDGVPTCDYQAALLSMPLIMKTTIDTVPTNIPYLFADPALIGYWRERLSHDKGIKIGICWQGNPNYSTHFLRVTVAAKSVPVSLFSTLADIPSISVYSLQRETGTDQLKNGDHLLTLKVFNEDFDKSHGRFMDTAAVIKNLDLVVTIDTSIAHLAAGLGIPVWIFIPEPPDWRWMVNRCDTPWYPNMRLFRQPKPGDWESVIHSVKQELLKFVQDRQTPA